MLPVCCKWQPTLVEGTDSSLTHQVHQSYIEMNNLSQQPQFTSDWQVTAGTALFCTLQLPFQIPETGKSFRPRWKHLSTYCLLQWSQGALQCPVTASLMRGSTNAFCFPSLHMQQEPFISLSYTYEIRQLKQGMAEESSVSVAPIYLDGLVH